MPIKADVREMMSMGWYLTFLFVAESMPSDLSIGLKESRLLNSLSDVSCHENLLCLQVRR